MKTRPLGPLDMLSEMRCRTKIEAAIDRALVLYLREFFDDGYTAKNFVEYVARWLEVDIQKSRNVRGGISWSKYRFRTRYFETLTRAALKEDECQKLVKAETGGDSAISPFQHEFRS